jgi:hypothetical protein
MKSIDYSAVAMRTRTTNILQAASLQYPSSCCCWDLVLLGQIVCPSYSAAVHDAQPHFGHWQLRGWMRLMCNCQIVAARNQPAIVMIAFLVESCADMSEHIATHDACMMTPPPDDEVAWLPHMLILGALPQWTSKCTAAVTVPVLIGSSVA